MVLISTRIQCVFDSSIDINFKKVAKERCRIIRIYSYLRFKTKEGSFTKPYPAIVDTGAYVSVIPHKIWSTCDIKLIGKYKMSGLVPKEECTVPVLVGEIVGKLVDMNNFSGEYKFMAYFTITDEFPLIIGFREVLENVKLYINYPENEGWMEEIK
ncbi:MAG: hypothetical protein AB1779_03780 [Candidatus Thermoplasmatota archaeon]